MISIRQKIVTGGGEYPHQKGILHREYLNGVAIYVFLALEAIPTQKGISLIDGKFPHHMGPSGAVNGPVGRGPLLIY